MATDTANKHYTESMLHQLDKLSHDERKFVYYITENKRDDLKTKLCEPKSTTRDYTIHFNLQLDAGSKDIFESYYMARLIDHYLQRT